MTAPVSIARKIIALLNGAERRELLQLFGMMIIAMLLETVGIGLVLPALTLLADSDLSKRTPLLLPLIQLFGAQRRETLIMSGMLVLVVVYFLKNTFLAYLIWRETRFSHRLDSALAQRFFALYLGQPYTFHLQRNSTQLINHVLVEVSNFTMNGLGPALTLCAEFLVLLALVALLVTVEPGGALVAGSVVAIIAWSFNRFARVHITQWGTARQYHEEQSLLHLQQGLGAAKDVILLGRESEFLSRFFLHNRQRSDAAQRNEAVLLSSKLVLEFLAITALAGLTVWMILRGRPVVEVLPTLGLFAAVAFRVLPSLNRVLDGMQRVQYSLPSVNRLYDDAATLAAATSRTTGRRAAFTTSIALADVSYTYPSAATPALDHASITIVKGESVGIIGSSGAGKSTLIDILLGLLSPTVGRVEVDGHDISGDLRSWQDQVGYVPQDIFLTDDSLRRNVAFGVADDAIDENAVLRAVRAAQLDGVVARLPHGLDSVLGERGVRFSGGERQRVGIARALYHDPAVLVLDEATSALDTETEGGIIATVNDLQREKTIVIVTHRHSTIAHCDRVCELKAGRIVEVRR